MKFHSFGFPSAAILLGRVASAWAGPLQRADVPADPIWVAHVDCDALRPTTVGQYVSAEMEKPEAQNKLGAFQAMFNFDLKTQLHALTLFNIDNEDEDAVLLVYADFDAEHLIKLAKGARAYESSDHGSQTIHSWIDDHRHSRHGGSARTYAAIFGNRVILFAQKERRVAEALDVLNQVAPSLSASKNCPELGTATNKVFLEAAARKVASGRGPGNSAVFRMSRYGFFQLGEDHGEVRAQLTLEANDEDAAGQILSIAKGLTALTKLQKDKPENVKLAEGLKLDQNGTRVSATLAIPASEAVQVMKAAAARNRSKKSED